MHDDALYELTYRPIRGVWEDTGEPAWGEVAVLRMVLKTGEPSPMPPAVFGPYYGLSDNNEPNLDAEINAKNRALAARLLLAQVHEQLHEAD